MAIIVAMATTAQAWHPVGGIKKEVQNVTQGSTLRDANNSSDAVAVNPGDTVKYVITVSNNGKRHSQGHNDMHYTKVTDTLPAGVALASGQTNTSLGHIKAGESKHYEFTAKVTSNNNGEVICNTASFTGDSEVYDQPQKGSDKACIKVVVPAPKMIEVCYIGKGKEMHEIKETEFNSETMSKDPKDCKKPETPKPVDKNIEICVIADKEIKIIKESKFNKKTMTHDKKECDTPAPKPAPTPQPTAPIAELPQTGVADFLGGLIGIGSVTAASVAYFRSRR